MALRRNPHTEKDPVHKAFTIPRAASLALACTASACGALLDLGSEPGGDAGGEASTSPEAGADSSRDVDGDASDAVDSLVGLSDHTDVDAEAGADADADVEADADADEGGYPVGAIPGLSLWLRADIGVSQSAGRVVSWLDQTSQGNDAVGASVDTQPTVVAAALNGLPAVHFGSDVTDAGMVTRLSYLTVADSASLQFGTGDFLIELVARPRDAEGALLYEKQTPTAPYSGTGVFVNWAAGTSAAGGWAVSVDTNDAVVGPPQEDVGRWRIVGMQRVGSVLSLRLDGPSDGGAELFCHDASSATLPGDIDVSAAGTELTLGAQAHPNYAPIFAAVADIAEVVAIKGSTTTDDLNGLEGYLTTKYAIH